MFFAKRTDIKKQLYFSPRRAKIPKLKSSRLDTVFGGIVFGKIITHPGIRYRQQFAHTCRNGNLIRLTLGRQALVEIPNKRFKTCRCHGSHIQCLTHRRPSAKAAAFEFGFPALPRVRGNAGQTRYPFVRQPPQFGHIAISVAVVIEPMPLICSPLGLCRQNACGCGRRFVCPIRQSAGQNGQSVV
ncbi:hypothetical protein NM477_0992 [Neisseria meningitidis NM477]|nr:hypothetical protein NM477_0992 [Neisseria meningitidis NM477]EQC99293.1 hypothetical protein NM3141_1008 [Neisseria meningitidis NM3141]